MVFCCGKKSIATSGDKDANAGVRRASSFENIRASLMGSVGPEETEWQVGGRYKVQATTPVFETSDRVQQLGALRPKDLVLLLTVETKACVEVGLVVPSHTREEDKKAGWIVLQDFNSDKSPLYRKRLESSWEMNARYKVNNPAKMRKEASLSSKEVGEVEAGREVLVLDLGLDASTIGEARLRAMISVVNSDLIGWISPETPAGDRLLDPMNLLGLEVVNQHRKSLAGAGGSSPNRASIRGSIRASVNGALTPANTVNLEGSESAGLGGPQRSCVPGATLPWEVGGKYRVLEKLVVRERPDLSSREIGKVSAGALAVVTDIHNVECAHLGWCPCAFINVDEGPEEGTQGWVRCAAREGHDLMDTRDHLASAKIMNRLRASQVVGQRPQQLEPMAEGDEAKSESTSQSRSSSSTSEVGSLQRQDQKEGKSTEETLSDEAVAGGKTAHVAKAERRIRLDLLESDETAREDRLIGSDGNAMEGQEKAICGCNCGGGSRRKP